MCGFRRVRVGFTRWRFLPHKGLSCQDFPSMKTCSGINLRSWANCLLEPFYPPGEVEDLGALEGETPRQERQKSFKGWSNRRCIKTKGPAPFRSTGDRCKQWGTSKSRRIQDLTEFTPEKAWFGIILRRRNNPQLNSAFTEVCSGPDLKLSSNLLIDPRRGYDSEEL